MKGIKYEMPNDQVRMVAEPQVMYVAKLDLNKFSISSFSTLNTKLLFTQLEWADILHISDRTLQRYIKENKPFEGLYAEHLHQLGQMADLGMTVFSDAREFDKWLRTPKTVLGKVLDFSTLKSFWGVMLICQELGRIEHGVYI